MSEQDFREIARNGLWRNNPGLVQLLGLCPLLGTSNSTVNALGLGLATMLVLACSNAAVSLVRGAVSEAIDPRQRDLRANQRPLLRFRPLRRALNGVRPLFTSTDNNKQWRVKCSSTASARRYSPAPW